MRKQRKRARSLNSAALILACALAAAAAAATPPDRDALLRQADQYVQAGKLEAAREAYQSALKSGAVLENDYPRARNLGLCFLNGTPPNFPKAIQWLQTAFRLRPNAEDARLLLAQAMIRSGAYSADVEHEASVSMLQGYMERYPSDTNMRLEYARLLGYARRFPEALTQYRMVLQTDPNNVGAQVGVAKITAWHSDHQQALEMYERILQQHPGLYDAQVGKAFTLLWTGRPEEARLLFLAAARRNPNDREVEAALRALGTQSKPAEEAGRAAAAGPAAPKRASAKWARVQTPRAPVVVEAPAAPREAALAAPSGWARGWPTILIVLVGAALLYRTLRERVHPLGLRVRVAPQLLPAAPVVVTPVAPVVVTPVAPVVAEQPRAEAPQLQGRILLVDDEAAMLEFEREVLAAAGAEVVAVGRAQDALVRLESGSFDAVIADGKLSGGCSGMEIFRWLQYNRPGAEKKIMLTLASLSDPEVEEFVEETGVLCLIRPFGVPDLVVMTRLLLQKSRAAPVFVQPPPEGQASYVN